MKKLIPFFMSILMVCSLSACGSSSSETASETASESAAEETAEPSPDETAEQTEQQPADTEAAETEQTADTKSTAVVYFSATGNTAQIANYIAEILDADIYEIQPAEPYTADDLNYNDDGCRANAEMNDPAARPEIGNDLSAVTEYDTVFIGHPIWWGTAPRIINTFMETYDLSGKNVYTFCTSGGSGIGQSLSDLQNSYPDVNIIDGRRFDSDDTSDTVKEWLDELE